MNRLQFNNKLKVSLFIGSLCLLFIFTFVFPIWILSYFKFSGIKHLIVDNYIITFVSGVIIVYFITTGQYYYNIYVDSYVIKITSFRPILDLITFRNYVDISHSMLVDYSFFNRSFTFNKTLMLKIKANKKVVIKRFNLTLISKAELNRLSSFLDKIIENNK